MKPPSVSSLTIIWGGKFSAVIVKINSGLFLLFGSLSTLCITKSIRKPSCLFKSWKFISNVFEDEISPISIFLPSGCTCTI